LQRHNLGSVVSSLVLGSPTDSLKGKSKKDAKQQHGRSLEKRPQDSTIKCALDRVEAKGKRVDMVVPFREKNLTVPVSIKMIGLSESNVDDSNLDSTREETIVVAENGCDSDTGDIQTRRSEMKRTKKQIKQQIANIATQTDMDLVKMEQDYAQKRIAWCQKLKSLRSLSDPAECIKYLGTCKVAQLQEEGKCLREEMTQWEKHILEETTLMNRLIRESLSIQSMTRELMSDINRAECDHVRYSSTLISLQEAICSLSKLQEEAEHTTFECDQQSFVSNFVPILKNREYVDLKRRFG
jgi:hypothetical protein